jgi:uncharacterized repeat protein (TIGR01451 family)
VTVTGPPSGEVSGIVFDDADGDGVQDPGETPLPGMTVTLLVEKEVVGTDVTDSTGAYRFAGLPTGTYTLRVTAPAGPGSSTTGDDLATLDPADGEVTTGLSLGFRDRLPRALTDTGATPAGTPVILPVVSNDDQGDAPATITVLIQPTNGTVSCGTLGCTYTPRAGFYGSDTFAYTITDVDGDTSSATVTITVSPPADLGVSTSDIGTFTVGSPGTYTITVSNAGPGPAAGPIVVTATLPPEFSFLSASGDGWSCSPSARTVTCTHAGPLEAGASLPAITLVVSVPPSTPPSVVTTATVWSPTPDPAPDNTSAHTTAVEAPANQPPAIPPVPTNQEQVVPVGRPLAPLTGTDPESGSVRFQLVSGALPPGVVLNADGTFTGVPSVPGDFLATIRACDNRQACVERDLVFRVADSGGNPRERVGPPGSAGDTSRSGERSPGAGGPDRASAAASPAAELPRSGSPSMPLAMIGLGLVLAGGLLVRIRAWSPPCPPV